MEVKITQPLLPLRDIVVFPSMVIPLFVGRDKSIKALNEGVFTEEIVPIELVNKTMEELPTKLKSHNSWACHDSQKYIHISYFSPRNTWPRIPLVRDHKNNAESGRLLTGA